MKSETIAMIPEDRAAQIASLKRELFSRHERRRIAETDPELTASKKCDAAKVKPPQWKRLDGITE